MLVTLISHTPMPEKTVAAAAKLCYSAADIETVMDGLTEEKTAEDDVINRPRMTE